jgi:transcriptional regulator with XRE-family HTH domain
MDKKINQREIARKVGVSHEHLNRILNRRAEPNVGLVIRIAKAIGAPVEELWIDWAGEVPIDHSDSGSRKK